MSGPTARSPRSKRMLRCILLSAVSLIGFSVIPGTASADGPVIPPGSPRYFPPMYRSAMSAPLPFAFGSEPLPLVIPTDGTARDAQGLIGFHNDTGPVTTAGGNENAFFKSLGSNGRSCGTCHLPSQGMSFTAASAQSRFRQKGVKDPLFAPVDGANCPNLVPLSETKPSPFYGGHRGGGFDSARARSLLLKDGLIRIFLPYPKAKSPDFAVSITPQDDPYTCNTQLPYSVDPGDSSVQMFSMYRRPLISANLAFKTKAIGFGPTGPAEVSPSGNIMWDGREPTLASQGTNATLGHAQAVNPPTSAQLDEIVAFEVGFFSAQQFDRRAGFLTDGANGGPQKLKANIAADGVLPFVGPLAVPFNEFDPWAAPSGPAFTAAQRQSIKRGQDLFNGTAADDRGKFTIDNVAGFNDAFGGGPVLNSTCGICHNGLHGGGDMLQANQRNIGTAGDFADNRGAPLRRDLPVFTITCAATPTFRSSNVIKINDPGMALITGRCGDVGKFTVPSLRGAVAHPPFFHDGSANTLYDVVNFYDKRFNIGLTTSERADLVNFLSAL
jgi:cytochrome c peroxidase